MDVFARETNRSPRSAEGYYYKLVCLIEQTHQIKLPTYPTYRIRKRIEYYIRIANRTTLASVDKVVGTRRCAMVLFAFAQPQMRHFTYFTMLNYAIVSSYIGDLGNVGGCGG